MRVNFSFFFSPVFIKKPPFRDFFRVKNCINRQFFSGNVRVEHLTVRMISTGFFAIIAGLDDDYWYSVVKVLSAVFSGFVLLLYTRRGRFANGELPHITFVIF